MGLYRIKLLTTKTLDMKTYITVALLGIALSSFAQINRYSNGPIPANIQSTYTPLDLNAVENAINKRQQEYDDNQKKIDGLIDWIYELKGQTSDEEFKEALSEYYKTLRSFDGQDLSRMNDEIRDVELGIKELIDKYNSKNENNKSTASTNDDANTYWKLALVELEAERYDSYLKSYLDKVIELAPEFANAYYFRGIYWDHNKQFDQAVKNYKESISKGYSEPWELYNRIGWIYYFSENLQNSLESFNSSISSHPTADGYFGRAFIKSSLGDYYGDIIDNQKCIELEPNNSMAYNNMGWAKFNLKKYKEALADVNKAVELNATNYTAWDSKAEIELNMNNNDGCISSANKALGLNANLSNSYLLLGRAYHNKNDKEKACINWSKAGELGRTEAYDYIKKYCQ